MPTYVYRHRVTGETIEKQMAVAERDNTPPDWERVTVPSSIAAPQFKSNPHTAAVAVPKAFREYELAGNDCRKIERETGFSRAHIRRVWNFLAVLLFTVALPALAGDLTKGYSFTPNDRVTNVKLNNLVDNGTVNTSFFTGKTSEMPVATDICLYYNVVAGVYRKITFGDGFLNNTNLIVGKSEDTAPASDDYLLSYDKSGNTLAKVTVSNLMGSTSASNVFTSIGWTNSGGVRRSYIWSLGNAPNMGTPQTFNASYPHNFFSWWAGIQCTNADGFFSVGDMIDMNSLITSNYWPPIMIRLQSARVVVHIPGSTVYAITNFTTIPPDVQVLDGNKWIVLLNALY